MIPHAAGHELIRQAKRDLTLIKMTPDIVCDQLIGAGHVTTLQFAWGGSPGVGSLYRFRDAVENGWPIKLKLDERSHADMAVAYAAGASRLPFGVIRGYRGTDTPKINDSIAAIRCPFTGEKLAAVAAIRADVAIIHAQRADRSGNVQFWGISGVQKEAVMCADKSIVTVEEIVDELLPVADQVILPNWLLSAVCEVPRGAHPSYALGYSVRDNSFYAKWSHISADRKRFRTWINCNVVGTDDFAEYMHGITEMTSSGHGR